MSGTFGHGSSLEKYFYYGEIIMAAFTYTGRYGKPGSAAA
ncbi:TPA: hypothetical protein JD196_14690 [Cronobacter sakazakii]|nr:hypothetical protein [Cronobacter sakazakii]MCI0197573.1 hypothetical protein [Cronobacter sakazakii]MCI0248202.1 hypothetical protein [Cronobacter sakazakii]MCI0314998.1 hypothetical protein [Cronobacter sakazakii]RHW60589.1 hypothetical protein DOX38_04525 [Cronobacter sakazakii]HAU5465502.1 hypothetical protein [Cronobacter sakazakii]